MFVLECLCLDHRQKFLIAPLVFIFFSADTPYPATQDRGMASIPQTLQLVRSHRKKKAPSVDANHADYYCMAELDQPMRYSSKLMNSIWGRYNENSVHNFKSLQCGGVAAAFTGPNTQVSPSLPRRDVWQTRVGELGEAVAANVMDNLNQY